MQLERHISLPANSMSAKSSYSRAWTISAEEATGPPEVGITTLEQAATRSVTVRSHRTLCFCQKRCQSETDTFLRLRLAKRVGGAFSVLSNGGLCLVRQHRSQGTSLQWDAVIGWRSDDNPKFSQLSFCAACFWRFETWKAAKVSREAKAHNARRRLWRSSDVLNRRLHM